MPATMDEPAEPMMLNKVPEVTLYFWIMKVFATTLGHNNETVADARYLDLVARGLLWSVGKLDDAHLKPAAKVMLDAPDK